MLFDLDGTLTDNYPGISRSIAYALDGHGHSEPPASDVLRRCVGPPLRESFAWLLDTRDPAVIEQAIALYRERYGDVGWRENVRLRRHRGSARAHRARRCRVLRVHVQARDLRDGAS